MLEKNAPYYLHICFPSDLEGQSSWTPQSSDTGWDSVGVPSKSSLYPHPHDLSPGHDSDHEMCTTVGIVYGRTEFKEIH